MADQRVLVVQPARSDPPGRLADWLREEGFTLDVRDLEAGDTLPDTPAGHAALIVLGGGMGANDDAQFPVLADVRALLRDAVSAELPTLAICLGAQLLAAAHGGRVGANPEGPELGAQLVAKRSFAATDPLLRSLPITPDVVQWHWDAVLELPVGAHQLASSPTCENQAFRLGRLAWGLQFHLETTPAIVREWARTDAPRLPDYDLERIVARVEALDDDVVEVWRPFVAAFAEAVRDPAAVPAPRGARTSTAEPVTDPAAIRAALAAEADASRGGVASLPFPARPDRP